MTARDADSQGLLGVLEDNRHVLLRYLRAHGAADAAEDLLQELRLKVLGSSPGAVQSPLSYLYRVATNLMIDHRRSAARAAERDAAWAELLDQSADSIDPQAPADRRIAAADALRFVNERLPGLPERARRILLRHRIGGISQRLLAEEYGISPSTVESDLRLAYRWLDDIRRQWNEEIAR